MNIINLYLCVTLGYKYYYRDSLSGTVCMLVANLIFGSYQVQSRLFHCYDPYDSYVKSPSLVPELCVIVRESY